ncbi:alpha/beta-hydrolase [Cryphonectria parasitica EP155]|uniref:Alpha/beta-hydrolase n=1 Tax=Cryphonectria parasitica (strain ATCC 38755 / EP155) TaxID=660469 RepID=A0A9P4Y4E2_CRYP1|nr:alpha/beta-hydrolase [Cryphonectria parasitica EP155]KAF3766270.1 alpha/beta-hydrolase [Cryphonectria parasitica EP155]
MIVLGVVFLTVAAAALPPPSPYLGFHQYAAQETAVANLTEDSLTVDLGYGIYRGWTNESASLNIWQGIRFAQDTGGKNRWQPPRAPFVNRSAVIQADAYGAQCPQSPDNSGSFTTANNSASSEDCLFINVYAPNNITTYGNNTLASPGMPVMVWIHGGGYGEGNGAYDLTALISTNGGHGNHFIGVDIQYRLGAFGFLSSDEVYRKGVVNAGLLDQQMALQWVQQYIHLFNGDNTRVTIFGESSGGGSVTLHDLAYGGTLGTQLFRNSISASPYLAFQYGYKDWQPSQAYYAFAAAAGCDAKDAYLSNGSLGIFDCLVGTDSATLMNASAVVSQSGTYGTWAFLPVTDGVLIQERPSKQLARGRVNGLNHLAGNNALEGAAWVPTNIDTVDDLVAYLQDVFPMFSNNDIAKILRYYPANNASTNPSALKFATEGSYGPTNINESTAATGQQERAIAIYGETTFICPSYWLAEAYSDNGLGGQGYKYQWSVPNAYHGADGAAYFSWPETSTYYNADLIYAFMLMLGNFIVSDSPRTNSLALNGLTTGNATYNPVSDWPPYTIYNPTLMDVNTTCTSGEEFSGLYYCRGNNTFRLADAYDWEAGRGFRCDFWRSMGELVPE